MNKFLNRLKVSFGEMKLLYFKAKFVTRSFVVKKGFLKEKALEKQKVHLIKVGDYKILANKAHSIEFNLLAYKYYSKNLPRIINDVIKKYKNCSIIDIGANIGDTVALIRSAGVNNKIICIEGLKYYYDLLSKNIVNFENVLSLNLFLGENNEAMKSEIKIADGTARIASIDGANNGKIVSLDSVAAENNFNDAKIIKVDTDGYDFKIIRGGLDFISKNHPVIFLEYDEVYLSSINEDGIGTLKILSEIGYNKIMYYDNFGKFLCSTTLDNLSLLNQLYGYIKKYSGSFPYYDICIFHKDDDDLADQIIRSEELFFA